VKFPGRDGADGKLRITEGAAEAPQTQKARVLIVDDDPIVSESLADFLKSEGHEITTSLNAKEAMEVLTKERRGAAGNPEQPFDVVICDVALPGTSGMELLRDIGKRRLGIAVIMLTGYGTVESAVDALRLGACDYLTKPVVDQELRLSLERAVRQRVLLAENRSLRTRLEGQFGLGTIMGSDPRMLKIYELIGAVAPSRTTVLMTGESGTGKSLIAHAIHQNSPRKDKPFVELSCGSIPETLLESELFGHVKGAFTGAHADKVGKFLAANGGTIFLDEINSASPGMQLKLLRVLQERRFEPVGSTQTVEVDVRVVLASNQPLEQLVADGRFRQDLYYRINVVKIELPALRERVADIPLLAEYFLEKFAKELSRQLVGFSPEAMDAVRRYSYPGNVRELQNVVERAAVLSRGQVIGLDDLPTNVVGAGPSQPVSQAGPQASPVWMPMTLEAALREPEKQIIVRALDANGWNRQKTSEVLGINRTTLYKKMKAYGLLGSEERMAG
jgi:DNA-binding NtrC family response regulator